MSSGMGKQIKEMRVAMGHKQSSFARLLGVDVGTLSRWERGTQMPRHSVFEAARDLYSAHVRGAAA